MKDSAITFALAFLVATALGLLYLARVGAIG